jgi:hypothetical protein
LLLPLASFLKGSLGHAGCHDANVEIYCNNAAEIPEMDVNGKSKARTKVEADSNHEGESSGTVWAQQMMDTFKFAGAVVGSGFTEPVRVFASQYHSTTRDPFGKAKSGSLSFPSSITVHLTYSFFFLRLLSSKVNDVNLLGSAPGSDISYASHERKSCHSGDVKIFVRSRSNQSVQQKRCLSAIPFNPLKEAVKLFRAVSPDAEGMLPALAISHQIIIDHDRIPYSSTTDRIVHLCSYSRPIHLDKDAADDGCLLQEGKWGP